jgi:predicted AAA+ superfamily ATPase
MDTQFVHREIEDAIRRALEVYEVITLTGPRQSGKTTLCRRMFSELPYANMEDLPTLERAKTDVTAFVKGFERGAIIDEAQNFPEILSALQVIVDEDRFSGNTGRKFIVTGSSNFALLSQITQSMAGRTALFTLLPFALSELSDEHRVLSTDTLMLRGGYPAVWQNPESSSLILDNYYNTYVERDVRQVVNVKDMLPFYRFMRLCAGRIGTEFNATTLSNEVGVSVPTIRNWLSVLAASYIIYLLPPYASNIKKRLVKTPKIYFHDTGLATYLLGIEHEDALNVHPLRGALFENMVMNEMMKRELNQGRRPELYFYRDQSQREVDVVKMKALTAELYEIKSAMTFHADFLKNLKYVGEAIPETVTRSGVIYDGDSHPENGIWNVREISESF